VWTVGEATRIRHSTAPHTSVPKDLSRANGLLFPLFREVFSLCCDRTDCGSSGNSLLKMTGPARSVAARPFEFLAVSPVQYGRPSRRLVWRVHVAGNRAECCGARIDRPLGCGVSVSVIRAPRQNRRREQDEAHIPAEQPQACPEAWLSAPHVDPSRSGHRESPPPPWSREALSLTSPPLCCPL
jgi:hypothetical protein